MSLVPRPKKSPLWNHFKQIDRNVARCLMCKSEVVYRSTTSNLKKHNIRNHPTVLLFTYKNPTPSTSNRFQEYKKISTPSSLSTSTYRSHPTKEDFQLHGNPGEDTHSIAMDTMHTQSKISDYTTKKLSTTSKKNIDEHLMQLFIKDFQPFLVVEYEGFKSFVKALNPSYELPSRQTISGTSIPVKYEECKTKVKELSNSKSLCITTDCWTSRRNDSYIAHFIYNGKFIHILLDCKTIGETKTIDNLSTVIREVLEEWNVFPKIIFAVADNAPNIQGALKDMQLKSMGYAAHKINLIVEKGLKSLDVQSVILKIKMIVAHFRMSAKSWKKLAECQQKEGIERPFKMINSVATRWNSTLHMLSRFVELEIPIKTTLALIDAQLPALTSTEWQLARDMCTILRPFEQITENLSMQKYPPASCLIVMIRGLLHVLKQFQKDFVQHKTMIDSICKRNIKK